MSLSKYTLLNTLTYGLALFGPALLSFIFPFSQPQGMMLTILFYIIGAALMIFYLPYLDDSLVVEKKQAIVPKKRAILEGFIGIFILLVAQYVANILDMTLSGNLPTSENTQSILSLIQQNAAFILIVSIAGPIMEEIFFRRTLIGFLGNQFNFWLGVLGSSFLFYLAHQDGHFLVYFIMGLTLALIYRSTGNIITSIIAHCGMNTFVIIINLFLVPLVQS